MVNLADLARKEADLPYDAPVGDILRNADEVEAFLVSEPGLDPDMPTRLLTRYARRLSAATPTTLTDARLVLSLAAAGHRAAEAAKASTAAYEAAYEQVRIAVDADITQSEAARISGLDRMTVRKALGKPRGRKPAGPGSELGSTTPEYEREDSIIIDTEIAADDLFTTQAAEPDDTDDDDGVQAALELAEMNSAGQDVTF